MTVLPSTSTDDNRMIRFVIMGTPGSWQRTNSVDGKRLTPSKMRAAKRHVRSVGATAKYYTKGWPMHAAYHVTLAYHRRRKWTSTPDVDNYEKLHLDSLNGVFWDDDRRVVSVYHQKIDSRKLETQDELVIVTIRWEPEE